MILNKPKNRSQSDVGNILQHPHLALSTLSTIKQVVVAALPWTLLPIWMPTNRGCATPCQIIMNFKVNQEKTDIPTHNVKSKKHI
jgi:hypothetical protein